jgi:hypothetical protein
MALAIAAATITGAAAQATYKKVGSAAGRDIYVNESTNSCLMAKGVGSDRQIQMGVSKTTNQRGYMALYTKKIAKVGAGEKVSVLFDIDCQKITGDATGARLEGYEGAYVHSAIPILSTVLQRRSR